MFRSYIRSILLYACPVWSCTSDSKLKALQVLQNKILRTIIDSHCRTTDLSILQQCNLLDLKDIIMEAATKMYTHALRNNPQLANIAPLDRNAYPSKIKHRLQQRLL